MIPTTNDAVSLHPLEIEKSMLYQLKKRFFSSDILQFQV